MKIEGEYLFKAPRERVFDLLQDPVALAKAMPGATTLTQTSPDVYAANVNVKIGAINGNYNGTVTVKDSERPEHFTLVVEGHGAAGFLKGEGSIALSDADDGSTLIHYTGETHVGGKIAQVGQRLVQSVARKMIADGLSSLEQQLVG